VGPALSPEEEQAELLARRERQEREVLNSIQLPSVTTKKSEVLIKHISEQAKRDSVGTAHILRSWLAEKEN
jgi:flagellar biosynthesis/type III secretory pathway M-ring protein FliF/YscJ